MAKWDYWDKVRAKTLVSFLESIPNNQYINGRDLEKICDIKDYPHNHERKIRALISQIIKRYGIPIVSKGSKGYKIATTQEDININKKIAYSAINTLKKRMDNIQINFDIYKKGEIKTLSDLINPKPKRFKLKVKKEKRLKLKIKEEI